LKSRRARDGVEERRRCRLRSFRARIGQAHDRETEGGFDEIVDFAGNEKSMAFAVSALARGGKIVVSGLMGGNFSLPMVQWIYKRMTIEGFMVGTLAEAHELMALARAGKIKPTPMREEPMGDVQKWIDELRAGKVVGRIVLKN
jgi:alcohol dehydrogenase